MTTEIINEEKLKLFLEHLENKKLKKCSYCLAEKQISLFKSDDEQQEFKRCLTCREFFTKRMKTFLDKKRAKNKTT